MVSLAVPNHFSELIQQLQGLPVFAVTFALVSTIWYTQFIFFRRYALSDEVTVVLTLLLLFVVLFYVYPLKFLFGTVFSVGGATLLPSDVPLLFLIYGLGFAGVNLVLALLYIHAYRKREELVERLGALRDAPVDRRQLGDDVDRPGLGRSRPGRTDRQGKRPGGRPRRNRVTATKGESRADCKPGSVEAFASDDHLSRAPVSRRLQRPLTRGLDEQP